MHLKLLFVLALAEIHSVSAQTVYNLDDTSYTVTNDCIEGKLSGPEMTTACSDRGLSCCKGSSTEEACIWDRQAAKVCKESCTGSKACEDMVSPNVGIGSCKTRGACFLMEGTVVGDNSCNSGNFACQKTNTGAVIGNDSCRDTQACQGMKGSVGVGSCNGNQACWNGFPGLIGDNSCNGVKACQSKPDGIGNNSCNAERSCTSAGFVGNDSCNNYKACNSAGDVGKDSCNAEIPDDSEDYACDKAASVGDCVETCDDDEDCPSQCVYEVENITGGVNGDPHFKTWSGTWFDYMGACDLHLVVAPFFAPSMPLTIDVRTKIRHSYSYIATAVIQIGQETMEVGGWGEWFLNGVESGTQRNLAISGFPIVHSAHPKQHKFEIHISTTEKIVVKSFKDMISIMVQNANVTRFHDSHGMMGEFVTGRMLARDGTTVVEDPDIFASEWQVQKDEPMLFQSVVAPQHPQACVLPSPAKTNRRRLGESLVESADAEAACAAWPADMKKNCIADVLATGDLDIAKTLG